VAVDAVIELKASISTIKSAHRIVNSALIANGCRD